MFQSQIRSLRLLRQLRLSRPSLSRVRIVKKFSRRSHVKNARTNPKKLVKRNKIATSAKTGAKIIATIVNPVRVVRIVKDAALTVDATTAIVLIVRADQIAQIAQIVRNAKAEIAMTVKIGLKGLTVRSVAIAENAETVVMAAQRTLPSVETTKVAIVMSVATEKDAVIAMVTENVVKVRIVTSVATKTSRMQIRGIIKAVTTAMLLLACLRRRRAKGSPFTRLRLQDLLTSKSVR